MKVNESSEPARVEEAKPQVDPKKVLVKINLLDYSQLPKKELEAASHHIY